MSETTHQIFDTAWPFLLVMLGGWALGRLQQRKTDDLSAAAIEGEWWTSRLVVIVSTVTCGLMFLIVVSLSAYTFIKTANVQELSVPGWLSFTGWLAFTQFWFFLGPAWSLLRWKQFRQRAETRGAAFAGDIHRLLLSVMIMWTAAGAFMLYRALCYYWTCLHGECSV